MKKITEKDIDYPEISYDFYEIKIFGHPSQIIYFDPDIHQIGGLSNGIAIRFPDDGWWLISYDDLIKMAELAKEARQ